MNVGFVKPIFSHFKLLIVVLLFLVNVLVLNNYPILSLKINNVTCSLNSEKFCKINCNNLVLNLKEDAAHLNDIIKKAQQKFKKCTLKLELCSYRKTSSNFWNKVKANTTLNIGDLKIVNSWIDLSDVGLTGLKNLRRLTIKNTTTTKLQKKIFYAVPYLQKLHVQNNINLKSVDKHFLRHSRLKYLQIRGINLDAFETELFFTNLTSSHDVPTMMTVDWSGNNFRNFSTNLLKSFPNLSTLKLINANISSFRGGFSKAKNIKNIYINNNKVQKLQEKHFRSVLNNISAMFLKGNSLICDCEMEWLQRFIKKYKNDNFGDFKNVTCVSPTISPFLITDMCPEKKKNNINYHNLILEFPEACNFTESKAIDGDLISRIGERPITLKFHEKANSFSIKNDEPKFIKISISNKVELDKAFIWLVNFTNNSSPVNKCLTNLQQNFITYVAPNVNYLFCLGLFDFNQISFECFSLKTQPLYENQTWLTKKSIPLSVVSIISVCLLSIALGALISYLSVHKNPALIRSNKRVIIVKRHDKAQILIMPRGYENLSQVDNGSPTLMSTCRVLEPCRSSLSCDTLSTASYVSANQPTQLELLTYRLNRLQEIFRQNHNLPATVPSLPLEISDSPQLRLPPNVDLLLEYEWYTITTTTTTQE